jgi:hypothetical protein
MRQLRIAHIEIRPVLVWDDGTELTPGPTLQAVEIPLSAAQAMLDGLLREVELLAESLADDTSPGSAPSP